MRMREQRYTHGHQDSVLRSHRWRTAGNSAAHLLAELAPGQALLDVGCGAGWTTRRLGKKAPGAQAVGIDVAPGMIAKADGLSDWTSRARFECAAIESFGRAAALDRTDANAPFHQGRLLAREGEIGAAIGALRLAHERNPGMTQATNVLARYLVGAPDPALRDVDEGTRLSESLPRAGPGAPAFEETRARAYAAAGRAARAEG